MPIFSIKISNLTQESERIKLYTLNSYTFYILSSPRDNIPTVRVASWPIQADLFDGEAAGGPVPTLFSPDPDASLAAISGDVAKAHHDLQKLAKIFSAMENIDLSKCAALIKKPRYNKV